MAEGKTDTIITVSSFTKTFGDTIVVDDLSFDVRCGEVFAFLGANGSGKTTTIRSLLNIYQPDSGELLINGERYHDGMVSTLGYLPEERGLYLSSKVLETLEFFGQLKGLSASNATRSANEFLDRVGLLHTAQSEIKNLSSGQQQKIQLGVALINRPTLLILDEPTKGLDPVNNDLLMDMLSELNKDGATVVFITHQMEEVEKIADRLVMIKGGKRMLYGGVHEVKEQFGTNTIHVTYRGAMPENSSLYTFRAVNNSAEIVPQEGVTTSRILQFLIESHVDILSFEVSTPSLHEIFVQVEKGGMTR